MDKELNKELNGRRATGIAGEEEACRRLVLEGYSILERNWRCRSGELDIIAEQNGCLVIVEVRTRRSSSRFGTAAESVNKRKQLKVRQLAQVYMKSANCQPARIRFDVIAVTIQLDNRIVDYKHYEGAF